MEDTGVHILFREHSDRWLPLHVYVSSFENSIRLYAGIEMEVINE